MKKGTLGKITLFVAGVGALNWGLNSLFNFNLVTQLDKIISGASSVVYPVVGLAGLLVLVNLFIKKKFL